MDQLDFDCEFKFVAGDQVGTVEGYASMFGVVDRIGDVVLPGAFKRSLADWTRRGATPPMLWQHNPNEPIGIWTELSENDRGLKVKGELILDLPQGVAARVLMQKGALRHLSIGFRTVKDMIDRGTGARHLKEIDLWEISLVTIPALREAIAKVKGINPRALESELRRDLGLSSADAVKAVALIKKHLRDGGETIPEQSMPRDEATDMLLSLRKAAEALRFDSLRS